MEALPFQMFREAETFDFFQSGNETEALVRASEEMFDGIIGEMLMLMESDHFHGLPDTPRNCRAEETVTDMIEIVEKDHTEGVMDLTRNKGSTIRTKGFEDLENLAFQRSKLNVLEGFARRLGGLYHCVNDMYVAHCARMNQQVTLRLGDDHKAHGYTGHNNRRAGFFTSLLHYLNLLEFKISQSRLMMDESMTQRIYNNEKVVIMAFVSVIRIANHDYFSCLLSYHAGDNVDGASRLMIWYRYWKARNKYIAYLQHQRAELQVISDGIAHQLGGVAELNLRVQSLEAGGAPNAHDVLDVWNLLDLLGVQPNLSVELGDRQVELEGRIEHYIGKLQVRGLILKECLVKCKAITWNFMHEFVVVPNLLPGDEDEEVSEMMNSTIQRSMELEVEEQGLRERLHVLL